MKAYKKSLGGIFLSIVQAFLPLEHLEKRFRVLFSAHALSQTVLTDPVGFDDLSEEDDWIQLGTLGQNISKLRPAFDPRLYGCKKLSDLIANQPKRFDLESRGSSATGGKDLYVRLRKPGKH